ncbi:hypothetical protein SDC9_203679 [bioreactor metagenome]|uniref:Uncharacterized protein n=1 Tax=bioreactor metagenome TaxID=1076179 RepID=A0A645IX44_9ZZZZ
MMAAARSTALVSTFNGSSAANRDPSLHRLKFFRADALNVHDILDTGKTAIPAAVLDYRLRSFGADAVYRLKLRLRGAVDVYLFRLP